VRGSYLGTLQELAEVFRLMEAGVIHPHIHQYELQDAPAAFERLRRGDLLGRAVIAF
jgi:alcohol dehydrogenase, propanol-preferring